MRMEHIGPNYELILLGILTCIIIYSLLTSVISKTVLTLPIIFVAIGYAFAPITDTLGATEELRGAARMLAEVTLVLVLFSDASRIRFSALRMSISIPLRMLVIGMPATIALGMVIVFLVAPERGFALALLTAAVLTPTDAALGQTVVTSPSVPERLRDTIKVESGLNDGLVLPFILLGVIMASTNTGGTDGLAMTVLMQVILGPVVGVAIGWLSARALDYTRQHKWCSESAHGVYFLTTAFVSFLASELVGGNGFIAAFVAGAVFGNTHRHDIHFISEFMEGAGQLLTMSAFLVFGALMLPYALEYMIPSTVLVALCFLTFVRMLPIWLSLVGTGMSLREKLFLGWFGPRGLASILFTLIMIDEFNFPFEEELLACVSLTVAMSVLLHGLSAAPFAKRIGGMMPTDPD